MYKKISNIFIFIVLSLLSIIFISSCNKVDVKINKINNEPYTLTIGDEFELNDEVLLLENIGFSDILIESSDSSILTVNKTTIKALKEGSASIKVSYQKDININVLIEFKVIKPVDDIIINITNYKNILAKGESLTLTFEDSNQEYVIESLDKELLSVDKYTITALKSGQVTIKVSCGNNNKEYTFEIKNNEHNIYYNLNGGKITTTYLVTYVEGDEYILPIPELEGYDFLGWSKQKNGTTYITKITKDDNSDITIYACFEKSAVISKITYELNGGECETCCVEQYEEGVETTLCTASKSGYKFLGWELNGEIVTKIPKTQKGDIVLKACFEKIFDGTSMVYELNGGSFSWKTGKVTTPAKGIDADTDLPEIFMGDFYYYLKTNNLLNSDKVAEKIRTNGVSWALFSTPQTDPIALYNNNSTNYYSVNDGYNQFFWDSIDSNNKPVGGFFGTSPYKEKYEKLFDIVYAMISIKYASASGEKLEPAFSFILDGYFYGTQGLMSNNDTFNNFRSEIVEGPKEIINITTNTILPTPSKVGYAFVGWYTDSEFNSDAVTSVSSNTKLYAKWYDLSYVAPSHKITYVLDGGTCNGLTSLSEEAEYILPNPSKEGYRFLGWSTTKNGTTYVTKIEIGNKQDLTFYANFEYVEVGTSRITYVYDAGNLPTHTATSKQEFMDAFWNAFYKWSGSTDSLSTFKSNCFTAWAKGSEYANGKLYLQSGKDVINNSYFINTKGNEKWMEWFNTFDGVVNSINGQQTAWGGYYVGYIRLNDFFNKTESQTISYWTDARIKKVYEGYPIPEQLITTCKVGVNKDLVNLVMTDGRTFLGWYDKDNNKITNTSEITEDITLYAKYSASTPVESLTITNKITSLERFNTYQINYTITPTNATNKKVTFKSSNTNVLTVSETGLLTAIKNGTATITIKCADNSTLDVSFDVKVYVDPFIDVSVDKNVLAPTEIAQIDYQLYQLDGCKVIFESSNDQIITVDKNGQVTAGNTEGYAEIILKIENSESIKQTVGFTVINTSNEMFYLIGQANNSDVHVKRNLNVAYAYLADVYVSVSDLLFNREYTVNTEFEAVQAANSSNHGGTKGTTEFICVHYTAGTSKGSNARATAQYMCNTNSVSIHYTTGNDGIFHCLDNNKIAWHAGDGTSVKFSWLATGVKATANVKPTWGTVKSSSSSTGYYFTLNGQATTIEVPMTGKTSSGASTKISDDPSKHFSYFGPAWKVVDGYYYMGKTWACFTQTLAGVISSYGGNLNSIGIESACNQTSDLWLTYQITAQLCARLLTEYKLGFERVVGHNFFSGKDCPQTLLASNGELWELFMECVKSEYYIYNQMNKYTIYSTSNNTDILSDNGRITKIPNYTTNVKYTVKVSDGTNTKEMTFSSIVHGAYTE